jgi:hypothetical protein
MTTVLPEPFFMPASTTLPPAEAQIGVPVGAA